IAVLGLGGVGGAAAEALCRSGVGHLLLVDNDTVSRSNCNRQLIATSLTVGQPKAEAAKARLLSINPQCHIDTAERFYLPEESDFLYQWQPDCVLDAIDTVTSKLHLAVSCQERGIPLLSSMGTGNRTDPSCLRLGDITETAGTGCPLTKIMRRELKKRGVNHLQVVFSTQPAIRSICVESQNGRHSPGSTAFVPPAAGFLLAYGAVKGILGL
ncbi:MAG: tRNA threonylcarbamoyladenosine dehydratase, partial [Angelakisella sp.]